MLRRKNINYALFAFALDLSSTLGTLVLAQILRPLLPFGQPLPGTITQIPWPLYGFILLIWTLVFFVLSVYDPERQDQFVDELPRLLLAAFFAQLMFAGTLFFSYREVSRLLIIYFFVLNTSFLIGWRVLVRCISRLARRGRGARPRRVLIVGAEGIGRSVARTIIGHSWTDLEIVGFLDDDRHEPVLNLSILGRLDQVYDVVKRERIEEVVIALSYRNYEKLNPIVASIQKLPVQVRVVPDYFSLALYRATVEDFGGMPLINLREPALTPYQRLTKRAFDLIVGSILLVASLPVMAIIALAIRLDSPGPIMFKQVRVGENGRLFTMYKFRSMVANAEELQPQVNRRDNDGNLIHKVQDDPRITPVGRFIRRTSLDELPQFVNVLKGEMSLVGPRPELPWLVEKYEDWQRKRFAVPQGLTGWWQVNGRGDKPMHLHTEDDLYYIQNYSILLDLQILFMTFLAVFKRQGAY